MRSRIIDGRGYGRAGTGIARYVRSLAQGLMALDDEDTRVLCFRSEQRAFRSLGVKPWPIPSGRYFRSWQLPRVALTHGPNFYALQRRGARSVITVHDLAFRHFPDDYPPDVVTGLSECLAAQQRSVDLAICVSEATQVDLLEAYAGFMGRTVVIPHGVDSVWFDRPDHPRIEATLRALGIESPYLLHLGSLVPRKNLGILVRAWLQVREAYPELALVLAGPIATGWKSDLATIRSLMSGRDDAGAQLHLIGPVDDPTAHTLMASARVYVCASKNEGFGLPVLEAMAAGIPLVATSIPAIREVAADTITYVPVGDVDATTTAIIQELSEPPELARIEAARVRARSFSWARCAEQTLACYRSLDH